VQRNDAIQLQLRRDLLELQRNDAWELQLTKLKAYKRRRGDCSVPQGWAEDPPLGSWVNNQRTLKKALDRGDPSLGMTAARVAKLDKLGFAWELSAAAVGRQRSEGVRGDVGWAAQLCKLRAYKRRRGDCNVPQGWAEDPRLGSWVKKQRAGKKALDRGEPSQGMTAARAAKLDKLGFVWELSVVAIGERKRDNAGWEAQLAKLKDYKRRHGDCNVPRKWAEAPGLGVWVNTQRTRKKKLDRGEPSEGMTVARAAKLEALGFNWAPVRGGAAQR
jgi:hypothetical protein